MLIKQLEALVDPLSRNLDSLALLVLVGEDYAIDGRLSVASLYSLA
jgi:hypothetical protein